MSTLLIKIIACIAMLTDHLGYHGLLGAGAYGYMRIIGRIAFPIYCYLIAFGYRKTGNKYRYLLRLVLLGLISEGPFNYCFNKSFSFLSFGNVFYTLALGLSAVICYDLIRGRSRKLTPLALLPAALAALGAEFVFKSDYGYAGVLLIFFFALAEENKLAASLFCALFAARKVIEAFASSLAALLAPPHVFELPVFREGDWGLTQLFAAMAIIPILLCDGSRGYVPKGRTGRKALQYSFYAFYPAHLLIIGLIVNNFSF